MDYDAIALQFCDFCTGSKGAPEFVPIHFMEQNEAWVISPNNHLIQFDWTSGDAVIRNKREKFLVMTGYHGHALCTSSQKLPYKSQENIVAASVTIKTKKEANIRAQMRRFLTKYLKDFDAGPRFRFGQVPPQIFAKLSMVGRHLGFDWSTITPKEYGDSYHLLRNGRHSDCLDIDKETGTVGLMLNGEVERTTIMLRAGLLV